ncbi:MAG: LamB/YcsF family protein, partial [Actinomycetia bacterium]|nr:LamB/YcsF family protein [Actinomycetes bacterium]
MTLQVDLDAVIGESCGPWVLGDDEALMPFRTSANVSYEFHGGDPQVMRTAVRRAVANDVSIGACVGLPVLLCFELKRVAASRGGATTTPSTGSAPPARSLSRRARLQHGKQDSALYIAFLGDPDLARAVVEAVMSRLGAGRSSRAEHPCPTRPCRASPPRRGSPRACAAP